MSDGSTASECRSGQAVQVPKLLLTPREAARALGISDRTLWALTEPRGPIPCLRIGTRGLCGAVRYRPVDLEQWAVRAILEPKPAQRRPRPRKGGDGATSDPQASAAAEDSAERA